MEISLEQKNEEIAKMLGWVSKYATKKDSYGYYQTVEGFETPFINYSQECIENIQANRNIFSVNDLKFNSDWNWLMKAVEFINSTHRHDIEARDFNYTLGGLSSGGYWNDSKEKQPKVFLNSIEDVFDAVYRYAKTWNGRKTYKITQEDGR